MIIDIDNIIFEMLNTMKNNFNGTPKQRFKQAKKLLLANVVETVEENKEETIKEYCK